MDKKLSDKERAAAYYLGKQDLSNLSSEKVEQLIINAWIAGHESIIQLGDDTIQSLEKQKSSLKSREEHLEACIDVQQEKLQSLEAENQKLLINFGIWLDKNDKHMENGNIAETVKEYLQELTQTKDE